MVITLLETSFLWVAILKALQVCGLCLLYINYSMLSQGTLTSKDPSRADHSTMG